MSDYRTNTTVESVAARIKAARQVLITSHAKPDGDAMGSCLALARAIAGRGGSCRIFLAGPIERALYVLSGDTPFSLLDRELPGDDFDLALVVDTGSWSQLEAIRPWLQPRRDRVIGIDHHARGDVDVASTRIVESAAVSTTAALIPIVAAMGVGLEPGSGGVNSVAEALFAGLATDSGWFRYPNAEASAFALAARLLASGVDKPRLYQILEENHQASRLAIEARALASIEYARAGAAAIIILTTQDFVDTGAAVEELTGIVNLPMVVGKVRMSILIAQEKVGDAVKISFRSKAAPPGAPADQFIDVNALAAKFGGGGHVHAAGAKQKKDIQSVKADVIAAVERL